MKISVITPSIRPDGLKTVFETLQKQTYKDFEWLPRLSIPGEKPDLCYQMNKALDEATGDLIVFLQDHIEIPENALELIVAEHEKYPGYAATCAVGKDRAGGTHWDWRPYWKNGDLEYMRWEIDFGYISRELLGSERFDLAYDDGFGWENVDLAARLYYKGVKFRVSEVSGIAFDHDKHELHPYKHKPNQFLWLERKALIELQNEGS